MDLMDLMELTNLDSAVESRQDDAVQKQDSIQDVADLRLRQEVCGSCSTAQQHVRSR